MWWKDRGRWSRFVVSTAIAVQVYFDPKTYQQRKALLIWHDRRPQYRVNVFDLEVSAVPEPEISSGPLKGTWRESAAFHVLESPPAPPQLPTHVSVIVSKPSQCTEHSSASYIEVTDTALPNGCPSAGTGHCLSVSTHQYGCVPICPWMWVCPHVDTLRQCPSAVRRNTRFYSAANRPSWVSFVEFPDQRTFPTVAHRPTSAPNKIPRNLAEFLRHGNSKVTASVIELSRSCWDFRDVQRFFVELCWSSPSSLLQWAQEARKKE